MSDKLETLTLDQAVERLADCTATYVDSAHLTFPDVMEAEDDDEYFLRLEIQGRDIKFRTADNAQVAINDVGALVLKASNGYTYDVGLLHVRHAGLA